MNLSLLIVILLVILIPSGLAQGIKIMSKIKSGEVWP